MKSCDKVLHIKLKSLHLRTCGEGVPKVEEHLSNKSEVMSSKPNTTKKSPYSSKASFTRVIRQDTKKILLIMHALAKESCTK
jgi:hypothetical protein